MEIKKVQSLHALRRWRWKNRLHEYDPQEALLSFHRLDLVDNAR